MDAHAATELIQTAAAVAAISRLIYLNLAEQFPALTGYLVFLAVIDLDFGLLNQTSVAYFYSYVVLEPLKCVLGVIAVRELFALTFTSYPGIRTVGRWVMYGGIALALGISLLVTAIFWSGGAHGRSNGVFYFETSQRLIVFTLAVVIGAILLFLSRYPLHLSRNTLVSSAFFSVLFLSDACRLLIDSLAPKLYDPFVDWSEAAVITMCLFGWAAMLRPEVRKTVPERITFSTPREDQLLQQLDALNRMMTRSARR